MAKRPQKRSGELTTPQLQQPQFQVQARPVDTAIQPNVAGAPAKPLMESDPARPDFQRANDLNRLGKSLMGLSTTINSLIKLEAIRTDKAQQDALDLMTETDKTLAQLQEEGKLKGVTPAHQRGYARAESTGRLLGLEKEWLSGEPQMRTEEGAVDPEYAERHLRRRADEIRKEIKGSGIHEGHFNKAFNRGFAELLNKVNRRHHAWAGEELQKRTAGDVAAELQRIAQTIELDGSDGQEARFDQEIQELIDGRAEGRLTQRAAHLAVGQAAVDLQIAFPELKDAMDRVLDNIPIGPKSRSQFGPPDRETKRNGRLSKISEIKNYRAKKQSQIDDGVARFGKNQAKIEFKSDMQGLESRLVIGAEQFLRDFPDGNVDRFFEQTGKFGFAALMSILEEQDPEFALELATKLKNGDMSHSPAALDSKTAFAFVDHKSGEKKTIDLTEIVQIASQRQSDARLNSATGQGESRPDALASESRQLGRIHPEAKGAIVDGVQNLFTGADSLLQQMSDEGFDIDQSPTFAGFLRGYEQFRSFGVDQTVLSREGLADEVFVYNAYDFLRNRADNPLQAQAAYVQLVRSLASIEDAGEYRDGLSKAIDRQLTVDQKTYLGPLIKKTALMMSAFSQDTLSGGLYLDSSNTPSKAIQDLVARATAYVEENSVFIGGRAFEKHRLPPAFNTEDGTGYGDMLRSLMGGHPLDITNSELFKAIRGGGGGEEWQQWMLDARVAEGYTLGRVEPTDSTFTRFLLYMIPPYELQKKGEMGGFVVNPEAGSDGGFSLAQLFNLVGRKEPGINAPPPEEQAEIDKKAEVATARQRAIGLSMLFSATPEGRQLSQFGGVIIARDDELGEQLVQDFLGRNPSMQVLLDPDSNFVLNPDLDKDEFERRKKLSSGMLPSSPRVGMVLRNPDTIRMWMSMPDNLKAALPELAWLDDPTQKIPEAYRMARNPNDAGSLFGTVSSVTGEEMSQFIPGSFMRVVERLGDAFSKVDEDYTVEAIQSAYSGGKPSEKTKLLIRLMEASPEGLAAITEARESSRTRYSLQSMVMNDSWMSAPETVRAYEAMTLDERSTLGTRFEELRDAREMVIGVEMSEEDRKIVDDLVAEVLGRTQ